MGLRPDGVDGEREDEMTKVAFCFPGQGSLEEGMGREIALAVPEAMEVYRVGSEASGLDLQELCFRSPIDELVQTEVQQPALVATSLAVLAALKARGIAPDYVVGHSVGEFAAIAAANSIDTVEAIGLVRERGLAMAEAARESDGTMAAILGRRSRASGPRTTTARARSSSPVRRARSRSSSTRPRRSAPAAR